MRGLRAFRLAFALFNAEESGLFKSSARKVAEPDAIAKARLKPLQLKRKYMPSLLHLQLSFHPVFQASKHLFTFPGIAWTHVHWRDHDGVMRADRENDEDCHGQVGEVSFPLLFATYGID